MRGFPLLQSILVVLAVILVGVPVYRLTRPSRTDAAIVSTVGPPTVDAPGAKTQPTAVELEAVFAPAPADFQVKNLAQTILVGSGPETRFTAHWTPNVPPDGADLVVQAHWPATNGGPAPAAARLTVRFSDGRTVEKSFWADAHGTLMDVLTLPGTIDPP